MEPRGRALAMVATAVMFLAVGALTSQLTATRRQAAAARCPDTAR